MPRDRGVGGRVLRIPLEVGAALGGRGGGGRWGARCCRVCVLVLFVSVCAPRPPRASLHRRDLTKLSPTTVRPDETTSPNNKTPHAQLRRSSGEGRRQGRGGRSLTWFLLTCTSSSTRISDARPPCRVRAVNYGLQRTAVLVLVSRFGNTGSCWTWSRHSNIEVPGKQQ
jgi:hypothetical protein